MPTAEFEEKQYEQPANIELGLHHAAVFAAGQVLEAVVGYDVVAQQPQNAPIWGLLGVNAPTGLQLVPNLWQRASVQPQPADLPSNYVSLVLQYKRPQYLTTSIALQWHYWNAPYYRFSLCQPQQDILVTLQNSTLGRATVRYACASFWQYGDLETYQLSRDILTNSAFVSPRRLVGHRVWTYTAPGTAGYANPCQEEIPTERFREYWGKAKKQVHGRRENLFEHLRGLATGLEVPAITDNTSPLWLSEFAIQRDLNPVQRQAVFDAIELAGRCGNAGSSWFVADLGIANP